MFLYLVYAANRLRAYLKVCMHDIFTTSVTPAHLLANHLGLSPFLISQNVLCTWVSSVVTWQLTHYNSHNPLFSMLSHFVPWELLYNSKVFQGVWKDLIGEYTKHIGLYELYQFYNRWILNLRIWFSYHSWARCNNYLVDIVVDTH